jgi:hypothetical protein
MIRLSLLHRVSGKPKWSDLSAAGPRSRAMSAMTRDAGDLQ